MDKQMLIKGVNFGAKSEDFICFAIYFGWTVIYAVILMFVFLYIFHKFL